MSTCSRHLGAAAVMAALTLGGLPTTGIASADTGEAGSTAVADPADAGSPAGVRPKQRPARQVTRGDDSSVTVSRPVPPLRPAAAVIAAQKELRPIQSPIAAPPAAPRAAAITPVAPRETPVAGSEGSDEPEDTVATPPVIPDNESLGSAGRPVPAAAATEAPLSVIDTGLLSAPAVPASAPGLTASQAVDQFFTSATDWLSGLPDSPVTAFLEGALLLVRRTLFNRAPVVKPDTVTALVDGQAQGNIGALDLDGDAMTYALTEAPTHGEVVIAADGSFIYTPDQGYTGPDTFTVAVADTGWHINLLEWHQPAAEQTAVAVFVGITPVSIPGTPYPGYESAADCGCQETWSYEGLTYTDGQCGNPDNDANGPWCRIKEPVNGLDWSYCRPKKS